MDTGTDDAKFLTPKAIEDSSYVKSADVTAAVADTSDTVSGKIEIATQAEIETATDVVRAITPGRAQFHPSSAKCWVKCGVAADILASYNIASLTDTGAGDVAVTIATDFSSAHWACVLTIERPNSTTTVTNAKKANIKAGTQTAGVVSLQCWDSTATNNVIEDPTTWHMVGFGDQI